MSIMLTNCFRLVAERCTSLVFVVDDRDTSWWSVLNVTIFFLFFEAKETDEESPKTKTEKKKLIETLLS